MLYLAGEYAYPGLNAFLYAVSTAVVILASCVAYATVKHWAIKAKHPNSR